MEYQEVIALLESNKNDKGIQHWNQYASSHVGLKSFGIGLTVLRKLGKKIGRDHLLALQLWESDIYDAKIMALLIDDPKQITEDQAEYQVENLNHGYLAHVFSSCDAALAKTSFAADLAKKWMRSKDKMRRSCSYGLIYELSKSKKKSAPDDVYFLECIENIKSTYDKEHKSVRLSIGGALIGIGKKNLLLNTMALEFAQKINPIEFESRSGKCDPLDVVKHLTSDYIKKKLGVQ